MGSWQRLPKQLYLKQLQPLSIMYTTEQFNEDANILLDLIQKCVEQEQLNEESWHKKHDEVIAMHYDNYENDMFDYDGDALASCGFGSDEDY